VFQIRTSSSCKPLPASVDTHNMKRQTLTILIFITFFFSNCDIEQNVKETISGASEQATTMLADSVSYFKTAFENNTNTATTDSLTNQRIVGLKTSINLTSNYIDSLRKVMTKFDNDVKNNEVVKDIFINKGISDSLFNKLNRSIMLAEGISPNPALKLTVRQIGDNMLLKRNMNEFRNQYFSINSPNAVTWLLSGMEIELYKAAATSLKTTK
jgi:hypothetical protein